jgi:hypothetical protein
MPRNYQICEGGFKAHKETENARLAFLAFTGLLEILPIYAQTLTRC